MRPDDELPRDWPDVPNDAADPVLLADGHLDEGAAHAFVDGALGDEDAARVIAHVAGCAVCAGRVAEARGLAAAATRILGALDDVPAGVAPTGVVAPGVLPTGMEPAPERGPADALGGPAEPVATTPDPRVRSMAAAREARAARGRSRWTGWPVRAAASLVLAAGLGSVVWRSTRDERTAVADAAAGSPMGAPVPAAGFTADSAAPAAAVAEATPATRAVPNSPPASTVMPDARTAMAAPMPPAARDAEARLSPRATAPSAAAPSVAAPSGAAERVPNALAAKRNRVVQLASVDSAAAPRADAASRSSAAPPSPPPAPAQPAPPPPNAAPYAGTAASVEGAGRTAAAARRAAAPSDAMTRNEVRRAGVPAAAPRFEPSRVMTKDVAATALAPAVVAPACVVLAGAPPVAGAPAPTRVRLDTLGLVVPAPSGVIARWSVAGDSLRLVWRWADGGNAARAEVRLGGPDAEGTRRGTAQDAAGVSAPAAARPVRCDGGLR